MIQSTINLASYAIAGAVAVALVGIIGIFLMKSVIKNLRTDETNQEDVLEVEHTEQETPKVSNQSKGINDPKAINKPIKMNQPKAMSKPIEANEPKIINRPKTKEVIFTKLSKDIVGESFSMMLEESLNIGRVKDKNDWAITNDHTVSSKHCKLYIADEKIYLIDLNSTNGTYVNQVRITHPVALKDNDLIRIGSGEYRIIIRD